MSSVQGRFCKCYLSKWLLSLLGHLSGQGSGHFLLPGPVGRGYITCSLLQYNSWREKPDICNLRLCWISSWPVWVIAVFVSECISFALAYAWKGKGPFLPERQTDGRCRLHLVTAVVMEVSMVDTPHLSALRGPVYKYLRAVCLSQMFLSFPMYLSVSRLGHFYPLS